MMSHEQERRLQAKLAELRRTILFLCNAMDNAAAKIDENPGLAKFMLKDAINDNRYEFR